MRLILLLAGWALLPCVHAQAAPSYGVGARPCAGFVSAAQISAPGKFKVRELSGVEYNSTNNAYIEWALGFMSGLRSSDNTSEPRKMSGVEFDQALRAYCVAHPTDPFVNAVEDLARREGVRRK